MMDKLPRMRKSVGPLIAAPIAIGVGVMIRVLNIAPQVAIGAMFAIAAIGVWGLVRNVFLRKWGYGLFSLGWIGLFCGAGWFLIHLWRTLPDH